MVTPWLGGNVKKPTNDTLVLFTLYLANAPLTINELAFRSGKSYNTVKSVLASDDRVQKLDGHPTRYYFAPIEELDNDVVRLQNDMPRDGWVSWMTKVLPKINSLLTIDKERSSEDIHKQALVVEALGINLVQFARELNEHHDKPDWFTLMGGNEND